MAYFQGQTVGFREGTYILFKQAGFTFRSLHISQKGEVENHDESIRPEQYINA